MNNQKKSNTGLIIALICVAVFVVLFFIGIVVFIVFVGGVTFFAVHEILNSNVIELGSYREDYSNYTEKMYKDYNSFQLDFKDNDKLTMEDFDKNNYYVFKIDYDPCSEKDFELNSLNTNYEGNKVDVELGFTYESVCGGCAPEALYYAIKLDKRVTSVNLDVDYKARNKKADCGAVAYKPMIYLYPEEDTYVNVKLGSPDKLTVSYPKYNNGWNVLAKKDGTLLSNDREYYGLFWEGNNHTNKVTDEGFVIKGEDTVKFLEEKLSVLGLNDREINEFIIFYLPKMEHNKYNYVRFETREEIDNYMPLSITPNPDTIIRIFMEYKPLDEMITVKEQVLEKVERNGFTVVEWGGSDIK